MSSTVNTVRNADGGTSLQIATVQMDANPAPTANRLARAERLVTAAVESGAQLVVLPELFSTGYSYSRENHERVETVDGPTATWMRDVAARLGIHLAGSLMLLDRDEVYNALLLYAPDGRMWRYDKAYPWGWERAFFRESRQNPIATVAKTNLGNIGMLVCWDVAHLRLWRLYAGRVDLMVICSSPPQVDGGTYHFPNGDQARHGDLEPRLASTKGETRRVFDDMINQQTAWLGVPAVNSVGCGRIRTAIPKGQHMLLGWAATSPRLLKYLPQASGLQMSCDMVHECKVVDAGGRPLAQLGKSDGETFTHASVCLSESRPSPLEPQPASPIRGLSYFLSDVYLPAMVKSIYREGQRKWVASYGQPPKPGSIGPAGSDP
jgi:hypothetical protein